MALGNLIGKLRKGLSKARRGLNDSVRAVFTFGRKVDAAALEEFESLLIQADLGARVADEVTEAVRKAYADKEIKSEDHIMQFISDQLAGRLAETVEPLRINRDGLTVILVVGVNGTGKTTTIAKIAKLLKEEGKSVLLVAADTFRAAAADQLEIWAGRANVEIVRHQEGADPGAVVFDGLEAAQARSIDVAIIDTAGRLHNKDYLVRELAKIRRVTERKVPGAPHETLMVIDASTGRNALAQARVFTQDIGVTGMVLTKLDGTAKGGAVISIQQELGLPVKYIGVGEQMDDLLPFDPTHFVEALFT